MLTIAALTACLVAAGFAGVRWLRVAQREHYLPGACMRFARRWWVGLGFNRLLAIGVAVNVVLSAASPFFAILAAIPILVGPFGLKLKGRAPGPVVWTRRLRTLAAIWALLTVLVVGAGAVVRAPALFAALAAAAAPLLVDVAQAIAVPIERRLSRPYTEKATAKLRQVAPVTIAITGSFGKTSTKQFAAHLIEGTRTVFPTPASFNNSAGLTRAINESLPPGTEVFIAEMGTYGPGEIAEMVAWVQPTIAAITAIGPVHLERMKSEDAIVAAKSEIFATATTAVLNVGDPRLAALADRLAAEGKAVIRTSGRLDGDTLVVTIDGVDVARVDGLDAPAGNVAVAAALARIAGVPDDVITRRLASLPHPANRLAISTAAGGFIAIDDTYNSNPAGTALALMTLQRYADKATHSVLVTPGMVELGDRQDDENTRFAAAASEIATDIVIVGGTNRKALEAGAHQGKARGTGR